MEPILRESYENLAEYACRGRDMLNENLKEYDPSQIVAISVIAYILFRFVLSTLLFVRKEGIFKPVSTTVFYYAKKIPYVQNHIKGEFEKFRKEFRGLIHKSTENPCSEMPQKGEKAAQIGQVIEKWSKRDGKIWKDGKISGAIYAAEDQTHTDLMNETFDKFSLTSPLFPMYFPAIRQMESEVVNWTIKLYKGHSDCVGVTTSGGTESILCAMFAYREYYGDKKGIKEPEIVMAHTAHAAFSKAGQYFKIKIRSIEVDPITMKADVKKMERAINSNTICIVTSAPGYPHGVCDDAVAIGKLALKYGVGCHLDACLGGFTIPFMEAAGHPQYSHLNFSTPGISSISADPHKYGNCPKGCSVIMLNNRELRRAMYIAIPDWSGGIYCTPTLTGSRPGSTIACAWATMRYHGFEGYTAITKRVVEGTIKIHEELSQIDEINILGQPDVCLVAFNSKTLPIFAIKDAINEMGWQLDALQNPPAVHFCVADRNCHMTGKFVEDLKKAIKMVKDNPEKYKEGFGAMYGAVIKIPDRKLVGEASKIFIELCTEA